MSSFLDAIVGKPEKEPEAPNKVRAKGPLSAAQAAVQRAQEAAPKGKASILAKLGRYVVEAMTETSAPDTPPEPPRIPRPPRKPPERQPEYDAKLGWFVPCSLSAEELASTVPSADTCR